MTTESALRSLLDTLGSIEFRAGVLGLTCSQEDARRIAAAVDDARAALERGLATGDRVGSFDAVEPCFDDMTCSICGDPDEDRTFCVGCDAVVEGRDRHDVPFPHEPSCPWFAALAPEAPDHD